MSVYYYSSPVKVVLKFFSRRLKSAKKIRIVRLEYGMKEEEKLDYHVLVLDRDQSLLRQMN
jgi:hypothetical protein